MSGPFNLRSHWKTAWSGAEIVVLRKGVEVDRVHAPHIERIVFVQAPMAGGSSASSFALVELPGEFVVFPSETGFAGRVHFERQAFWAARACIYWADAASAYLPPRCLRRCGFALTRRTPCYTRVAREEMTPLLERWVIEGPQSWEERRWQSGSQRIRPLSTGSIGSQAGHRVPRTDSL